MATLLVVNSSPRSNSVSRSLTSEFASEWKVTNPHGLVIERDLSALNIPLLNEDWIAAAYTPEAQRTDRQNDLLALSDQLIDELLSADTILFGIPMHNFSVPAAFKAWIDQIARAGKTFAYTANGPKGLIPSGKKVVAVITRGGAVAHESATNDPMATYLRQILGLIGLSDLTVIHADKQGMGSEAAKRSLDAALQHIVTLAHPEVRPSAA
jgi:FMN-dependent NADH-azoreductase